MKATTEEKRLLKEINSMSMEIISQDKKIKSLKEENVTLTKQKNELLDTVGEALNFISKWFYRIPSFAKTEANIKMIDLENSIKKATK